MSKEQILQLVTAGLEELKKGSILHHEIDSFMDYLDDLWNPKPPLSPDVLFMPRFPRSDGESLFGECDRSPHPRRPPPWYVGMSSNFMKDVDKIDRKIQGRILEALTDITIDPITLRGDTVKPLTGELQGSWRYRIGDYRLIYSPDKTTGDITLLAFASRGSVYED